MLYPAFLAPILTFALAATLAAQSPASSYFTQTLTGAFVYGIKAGPLTYNTLPDNAAPGFSINYSFRPRRWFALEAGLDQIVRPVGSTICCRYATNANDELFLIPFGARYVWEPRDTRFRFTGGGGGAYVRHAIGNENPAGGIVGFAGWGGQIAASADYAIIRSGRLRVGITTRYYLASPKASQSLAGPAFTPPNDTLHLLVIGPELVFSFH